MARLTGVAMVALASLLVSCASAPNRVDTASLTECRQIGSEVAQVEADKRAATEKKEGAWKNVIPFVVVGQYIEGKQDADAADKRLAALGDQAARQGCSS